MAKYEYTGTVTEILGVRSYGKNNIQQREFRCKEPPPPNGKWENVLPFVISYDPSGDKYNNLAQLDNINVGDEIKFMFVMRGRKWDNPKDGTTRYFVDNKVCSKIEVLKAAPKPESALPMKGDSGSDDEDDMPF